MDKDNVPASNGDGKSDEPLKCHLTPDHLAKLRGSGLTNATINGAYLRTESNPDTIAGWLGWKRANELGPCLAIQYFDWAKKCLLVKVRPANPRLDETINRESTNIPVTRPRTLHPARPDPPEVSRVGRPFPRD